MDKLAIQLRSTGMVLVVLLGISCSRQQVQTNTNSDTTGTSTNAVSPSDSISPTIAAAKSWKTVDEITVLGNLVKIGKPADDVYTFLTTSYRRQEPTILKDARGLIVTQHFLVEGESIDITFERPGNRYVVTSIRVREE